MPNFSQHLKIGLVVGGLGGGLYSIIKQSNELKKNSSYKMDLCQILGEALLGAGIGALAASLPDLLEPATSPNHRQFFHSITILYGIAVGGMKLDKSTLDEESKKILMMAIVGYGSHLFADAGTPRGLRLL